MMLKFLHSLLIILIFPIFLPFSAGAREEAAITRLEQSAFRIITPAG